jgi:Fur family zinc uptake transcriptional regulator
MQTTILNNIISYCNSQAINLTEQQSLVLKIICQNNDSVAAHEILDRLKTINTKANRMTIHRALDFLNKIGVIHKISFNNTYVPCTHLDAHNCQILVCTKCAKKIEFSSPEIFLSLKQFGEQNDFFITTPVEIMGYCKDCLN